MMVKPINTLQFICPTGFYGAERWIVALGNNMNPDLVRCDLVVTKESAKQNLEIVEQFEKTKGSSFEIEMSNPFDFTAIKKLCEIIKQREIDIIHSHGYKSDILAYIAARMTGIKCIATPHGFGEAKDFKLKLYLKLGAFCLRFHDQIVPLSKQLFDECLEYGVPESKLRYIQNGVDLKEVIARPDSAILQRPQDRKRRIGFIGQMIPRKKISHILEIFDKLWQAEGNIELYLLGDGSDRSMLEAHAQTLSSSSDIHFLGFRADRLEQLAAFDLFVMTSSSEGIPRCLMEAMAMGVPVAAYNILGIDQLLEHDRTGLLAEYGDKEQLLAYWKQLLDDPKPALELANNAKQFILDQFSAKRMADEYAGLFHETLEKSARN